MYPSLENSTTRNAIVYTLYKNKVILQSGLSCIAEFNKQRRSLTFYGTKFDLAILPENTNETITEEVIIKADTVIISKPIIINFMLKIRARIVSIDHPITMKISVDDFKKGVTRTKVCFIFDSKDGVFYNVKTNLHLLRQKISVTLLMILKKK